MQFIAPLVISFYISAFIYLNAFFVKQLTVAEKGNELFYNKVGIFLIILVPVFLLMEKLIAPPQGSGAVSLIRALISLIALLGLLVAFLYHVIPIEGVYELPAELDKYFSSDNAFTLWLIAPLLALFI